MKQALLAVSFGTSVAEARTAISAVEQALQQAVPNRRFFRAFTSPTIRRILAARGEVVSGLEEALQALQKQGYTDVVIQPTHFLYGYEYDAIRATVSANRSDFCRLALGTPLLAASEDLIVLSKILSDRYAAAPKQVTILLGHGTGHFANMVYPALQTALHLLGRDDILIGTVEGWPGQAEILEQLQRQPAGLAVLSPLMLVAGDHARNDMAGSSPHSWKCRLETAGWQVTTQLEGLGSCPAVQQLYVQHLQQALAEEAFHGV